MRLGSYSLFVFWLLYVWPAFGAGTNAVTLSGVEGFRIEIGNLSKTARELGLDESHLQTFAREHLQRATLPVGDFPTFLIISLRTVEHPPTVLAYCLEVEVRQVVHLMRTQQVQMLAPTWAEGKLSMVARASLMISVEHALADLLDALARDYRLVNQSP